MLSNTPHLIKLNDARPENDKEMIHFAETGVKQCTNLLVPVRDHLKCTIAISRLHNAAIKVVF